MHSATSLRMRCQIVVQPLAAAQISSFRAIMFQFRRLVSKPLFAIAAATVATDSRPQSRLSVEDEELLDDLEVLEQLDANGAAIPERICPCLKGEIDACGDKFLKSFGCALLYRRDFSKSTAECMRAHQLYIECKEAYDAAHKDDKKPEKTEQ